MKTVPEKITELRTLMKRDNIGAYIVPTADYHQSEYVGEYFKARAFLTGFTGSNGTAVVTADEACVWTDGRYFIQAASQLEGTGITLQKMGEPGVPTIQEYLNNKLADGAGIGFDGRTVGVKEGEEYKKIAEEKQGRLVYEKDLVDEVWENRPPVSEKQAFALELKYAGETVESKLERIRQKIEEEHATVQLITSLDDIGWMLNIRGRDVEYSPLLLSYAIVKETEVELYADCRKFDSSMINEFEKNCIHVYPYNSIYSRVKKFEQKDTVLVDSRQLNYALFHNIPADVHIVEKENPVVQMKAVKNETEIANIRNAHIKDGIAHTKFMYWLKTHIGKEKITEMSASEKLELLRAEQEGYLWPSFEPICAYREHAAVVHYSSSPETDVELKPEGLLLTDTGGNYWEGSTDITRTVALGKVTEEEKKHFTTVVT